jgi:hypothetical protein
MKGEGAQIRRFEDIGGKRGNLVPGGEPLWGYPSLLTIPFVEGDMLILELKGQEGKVVERLDVLMVHPLMNEGENFPVEILYPLWQFVHRATSM